MVLSPSPQTKLCIMLWLWPIYGYVSFWLGLAKQFFTVFFFFFFYNILVMYYWLGFMYSYLVCF